MKPLSQITHEPSSRRGKQPAGLRPKHPVTDYNYQATGSDFRVATDRRQQSTPAILPSIRQLSSEFLSGEMKRDYVAEAACFIIMVTVSAWPIVSMVRALSWLK
ncbi:MAG: hypothetical protein M3N48_05215 [Verrucomicrobiota bacterium]|nr:hypothetical protein [Verrucomicrobiota bacterium]